MKVFAFLFVIFGTIFYINNSGFHNSSRNIASEEDPAMVNELIDNKRAAKARHDLITDNNAERVFISTFEFEPDVIGLKNIKDMVDAAQRGVQVDLVLDPAGHKLPDEFLLYMVEKGVNVHLFSPTFSWTGIMDRYKRLEQTWRGKLPFISFITAVWRQATYRMHDKIAINWLPDEIGKVILGGRNMRDSHYGLDMRQVRASRSEGFGADKKFETINPAFEYEHEVQIKNKALHMDVETYVNDFLESSFTQRFDVEKARNKFKKSEARIARHGMNWRSKLASDSALYDDQFVEFAKSMKGWCNSYAIALSKDEVTNGDFLAKKLINVFTNNKSGIASLIDSQLIDVNYLNQILEPLYGKTAKEITNAGFAQGKPGEEITSMLVELIQNQKDTIEHNIRAKSLKLSKLAELIGPYGPDESSILAKLAKSSLNKIKGVGFDVAKFNNVDKMFARANEIFNEFVPNKPIDWNSEAIEVDSVKFLHDTVDDLSFRKKSMDLMYDAIANCEQDCIWNSQYGSLTAEAQNAIGNVLKKNSAIYRFVRDDMRTSQTAQSAEQKAQKIVRLFNDNVDYITANLENEFLPNKETIQDAKDIIEAVDNLIAKNPKYDRKLKQIRIDMERSPKDPETIKRFSKTIAEVVSLNKDNIAKRLTTDGDTIEKSLLSLIGSIDNDPNGVLPFHKTIKFHFMTNDVDSWKVGADGVIHADFHHKIWTKLRKMGPGLEVYGFNSGGRIHSKVFRSVKELVVSSMNADPRSERFNTEVGVLIKTNVKGKELNDRFAQHIFSYMLTQRHHMSNGQIIRQKQCFDVMTNIARKVMAPIL